MVASGRPRMGRWCIRSGRGTLGFRVGMCLKVGVRSMGICGLYTCLLYALDRDMLVSMK